MVTAGAVALLIAIRLLLPTAGGGPGSHPSPTPTAQPVPPASQMAGTYVYDGVDGLYIARADLGVAGAKAALVFAFNQRIVAEAPVSAGALALILIIAVPIGGIAGYYGGQLDNLLMRVVDITMAFPPILLAMAITASLGPGIRNALIGMILVWWPIYARLLRAQILSVKEQSHVEAAVAAGVGRWRLLRIHILPLAITPTMVNATTTIVIHESRIFVIVERSKGFAVVVSRAGVT